MEYEKKAQNLDEMFKEMRPFALYAAIPIILTIILALTFGVSWNKKVSFVMVVLSREVDPIPIVHNVFE